MSENEKIGVKETQEALLGILKLATVIADEFKDGIQAQDFAVVLTKLQSEPLKSELLAAYNGIDLVPHEAKDVELMEVISMLPVVMPEISNLIKAIKK